MRFYSVDNGRANCGFEVNDGKVTLAAPYLYAVMRGRGKDEKVWLQVLAEKKFTIELVKEE